jgi:DNA-binding protein Fis
MKKTQAAKSRKPSGEMRREYRFDYGRAKTNRFSSMTSRQRTIIVLDPEPKLQKNPAWRLHPVPSAKGFKPEDPQLSVRVQGLKDLALTLLKETQALEGDVLTSELTTTPGVHQMDIENGIKLDDAVRQYESSIIQQALLITGGNQARAARMLGVKPNTLNYKIKLYGL